MSSPNLQKKNALVTGASSGIGADIARALAARGYNLVLVARREEKLRALQKEIEQAYSVSAQVIPLDLTLPNAAEILFQKTEGQGIEVEILVNNAGYALFGEYSEMAWEREENLYQLDMIVPAHLTRVFLKPMLARKSGYILLVASIMGLMPVPTFSSYAGAKAFMVNYGRSLSYELRNTGVSVTVAAPGTTESEFFEVSGQTMTLAEKLTLMKSPYVARVALNAMFKRKPIQVIGGASKAAVVMAKFLPSKAMSWVTYVMMTFAPQR